MRAGTNAIKPFTLDGSSLTCPLPQAGGEGKGEGAIHTLHRSGLWGPIAFVYAPLLPGAKLSLAVTLLRSLACLDPRWRCPDNESGLTLRKSALGAPFLLVGDRDGPSLSFSHGKGRLWGAMCDEGRVGIDVAYPEEFAGAYPFHRAFNAEELEYAKALCPNDTARGAALMWAAKEASVKATGTGFNLFDPLEVRVQTAFVRENGILFDVLADRPITTWVTTEGRGWLSVALA